MSNTEGKGKITLPPMAQYQPPSATPDQRNFISLGHDQRPNTSASASSKSQYSDPFASPASSRPSSIRGGTGATSSRISFGEAFSPNPSLRSPFSQPGVSQRSSAKFAIISGGVAAGSSTGTPKKLPRMRSHAVTDTNPMLKPWNDKPNPRARLAYIITYCVILIGVAGGVVQAWMAYKNVDLDREPLCLVMEENFDDESAIGPGGTFQREVRMDGFGNGEFEMATASQNNSFVKDGFLYIVPTLTSDSIGESAVFDGTVYNITGCTFNDTAPNNGFITVDGQQVFDTKSYLSACSAVSNITAGTIINPVQSARLTTRKTASIRYGRVEFRAKMPNGDWLWPAIWMLPTDNVYGPWPLSGEIDIVESRGNSIRYTAHGSNYVQGTLNWGPTPQLNGASKSYSWWTDRRKSFAADFHTYALEWTPKFLRIYVDSRLHTLLDLRFNEPFFQRGDFPEVVFNGSSLAPLQNPWSNGTNATPFDQNFYLIMNVAVGSTNGWFPENQGNKPWLNQQGPKPMSDFAKAQAQWYPTWPSNVEDRSLIVDYVKMYKHCNSP